MHIKRDCEMANMSETDQTPTIGILPDASFEKGSMLRLIWVTTQEKMLT